MSDTAGYAAYFASEQTSTGELLHPLELARSGWNPKHLRGPAVTGILARATELGTRDDMSGLRPARLSIDLFRPARMAPSYTRVEVVQRGRRLGLVDAQLRQGDEVVARAHTLFLAPGADATGQVWHPDRRPPELPPADLLPDDGGRYYRSGDAPWSSEALDHLNGDRKRVWQLPVPLVEGEAPTSFQQLGIAADMTNLVVHWGTHGVEHINADASVTFARLPVGGGIGLVAEDRIAHDGISIGTAAYYDREGVFGHAALSTLANGGLSVRPGESPRA
ncbi:acyl-CoA thioesterase domain-containing protein [Flexivirga meconopsidis]|uniref:acyl-CoA thioesterase domain-containing protein n=1 Tax=Flexivirga meconopsidis TaxID=2977121 RepID=UPI0022408EE4|nr:acyl-CoA thioesterase domain-containing protein [Flexivirga meconopsidis]